TSATTETRYRPREAHVHAVRPAQYAQPETLQGWDYPLAPPADEVSIRFVGSSRGEDSRLGRRGMHGKAGYSPLRVLVSPGIGLAVRPRSPSSAPRRSHAAARCWGAVS